MVKKFINWIGGIMLWLKVVRLLVKHSKGMVREMKKEGGPADPDSPNRLTKDEIAMVVTDGLLDLVPELTELLAKHKK